MTPEERQRFIDFILRSQADSAGRLDRIEESHQRLQAQQDRLQAQQGQFQVQIEGQEERSQAKIDVLVSVCHDLVEVSRRLLSDHRHMNDRLDRLEGSPGT